MRVRIHSKEDFAKMRTTGHLAASTLDYITKYVRPGITTNHLNKLCHDYIIAHDAIPAPLGYKGYPKSICTSINHVVCHGIPDNRKLMKGDIVNIDVTVIVDGWYGDTSRMFIVGDTSIKAKRLIDVCYDALTLGIQQVRPGNTLGDIGHAIQSYVERHNFSVVREYCGHGIGQIFHDDPPILHHGKRGKGLVLQEGMFFTIEPMINEGRPETICNKIDRWTVTTLDKSLSAQFEHTLGVTKEGCEIFTLSPQGLTKPPYGGYEANDQT